MRCFALGRSHLAAIKLNVGFWGWVPHTNGPIFLCVFCPVKCVEGPEGSRVDGVQSGTVLYAGVGEIKGGIRAG